VDAVASLVSVPRDYASIERWSQPLLTLDFEPLRRVALNNVLWTDLSPAAIVTSPAVVFGTDFTSEPESLLGGVRVEALKDSVVHGIGLWFRSTLVAGISITNAPPNAVPSWDQGFLPLEEPVGVHAGESVCFEVSASASGAEWTWQVGSGKIHNTGDGRFRVRKFA
jgi:hypothetical protein